MSNYTSSITGTMKQIIQLESVEKGKSFMIAGSPYGRIIYESSGDWATGPEYHAYGQRNSGKKDENLNFIERFFVDVHDTQEARFAGDGEAVPYVRKTALRNSAALGVGLTSYGSIFEAALNGASLYIRPDVLLAAEYDITLRPHEVKNTFLRNTYFNSITELSSEGNKKCWIHAPGSILKKKLCDGESICVDPACFVGVSYAKNPKAKLIPTADSEPALREAIGFDFFFAITAVDSPVDVYISTLPFR